jgi:[heparan sulfate]-glucosamine 3-sulfotransferase 5
MSRWYEKYGLLLLLLVALIFWVSTDLLEHLGLSKSSQMLLMDKKSSSSSSSSSIASFSSSSSSSAVPLSLGKTRLVTFSSAKRNSSFVDSGQCLQWRQGDGYGYCFPSLICIGAMKAGTFELKQWLEEHPRIAAASRERHFFGFGKHLNHKDWESYVTGAPEWRLSRTQIAKGTVTFEKTPYYIASTVAAMEMHKLLPSVRLVALLRDPVARAYSSFYHHCDRNSRLVRDAKDRVVFNQDCATVEQCCCAPYDNPSPKKAKLLAKCTPENFHAYLQATEMDATSPRLGTILRKGLYAPQLTTYMRLFGRERLLVMDSKAFARDPAIAAQEVFRFMGLSEHSYGNRARRNSQGFWYLKGKESKSNKQTPYPRMLAASRELLDAFYEQPNRDLVGLFPAIKFDWMPGSG